MSFFQRFSFKIILFFVVLTISLLPLFFSVSLNLPTVLVKFSNLTESENINRMNGKAQTFGILLRRFEEDMRIIGHLPGTRSLVSSALLQHASTVVVKEQFSQLLESWFPNHSLEELAIIDSRGQVEYLWRNPLAHALSGVFDSTNRAGRINLWLEEARERKTGEIFIASLQSETIFIGKKHEHSPKILFAIPLVDMQGAFGGIAVGKFFLFDPKEKHIPFDLMINGVGTVFYDHLAPRHEHVKGSIGHHHQQRTMLPLFPDLIKATPETRYMFGYNSQGEKMLFWQVLPDRHREHSLWIAATTDTSLLDQWVHSFILRFIAFVTLLICAAFTVAVLIARKTDRARTELIEGITDLVQQQKPIEIHWTWPLELADLGLELRTLSSTFLETENELLSQASFIRSVFDGIQDGVAVIDKDFIVVDTNATLKKWRSELEPLTAKNCYQVFRLQDTPCSSCPTKRAMVEKILQRDEFLVFEGDGCEKWYEVSAYPIFDEKGQVTSVVEFFRDITEKKKGLEEKQSLEQQLAFAQKMESIGTLAGGVAHDFNNMLSAINGYAELSLMKMSADDPYYNAMDAILRSGKRAARITQQLLAFSRKQVIQLEAMDLNEEVDETRTMLKRLLGEHIEVVIHTCTGLWSVMADRTQIGQVLINLAVNARDAMETGGTLTIETSNQRLDGQYNQSHHELPAGDYVLLTVSDTGHGMSKETVAHIFEPFFTTKEKEKGTGLGLATSYGIIRQHGGAVHVYSEPGQGAVFKVYLPRLVHQVQEQTPVESAEMEEAAGGNETILLVEDDVMVRSICVDILKERGYIILEAENGEDALHVFDRYHGTVDLLLTDVVMPKMGGTELAEELRKLAPDIQVVFMSGYTENAIVHQGVLKEGIYFIHKPLTPDALSSMVRKVLS
jgi:PAS domain S-box-containing protein